MSGDLDKIAGSIEKKSNEALAPKHIVKKEDISKLLTEGAGYTTNDSFDLPKYKKEKTTENLWLKAECQGDTKKHEGEFLKKDGEYFVIGKKCECEERIRAFMRVLRVAEGTGEYIKGTKQARDPQLGYSTWFSGSGNNFKLTDGHPQTINSNSTKTLYSSAAGAYQIMGWKYDELNGLKIEEHNGTYKTVVPHEYSEADDKAKKYNAKGFSQESQDKLCIAILNAKGILGLLIENKIEKAIAKSSGIWVSLPGATAGQPTAKMNDTLNYYDEFLKEELSGNSHLHIKSGFLKEFDITCDCGTKSDGEWRMPIDNPMLCLYSQGGSYKPWHGSFGENIRDNVADHSGVDLLAKPGEPIYACFNGTINRVYTSTTRAGRVVVVKVTDKKTFNSLKNDYTLLYEDKGEILSNAFDPDKDVYLVSMHLSKFGDFKQGDTVKFDDVIGYTGVSGANGNDFETQNPHLHFEVNNVGSAAGIEGKCNPMVYFMFKTESEMTESDKKMQLDYKDKELW